MTTEQRRGLLGRLKDLLEGVFATWVRRRETRSPEAVYEQAIRERTRQYRELKQAVAGILYMRNRLEREIRERRTELVRLQADIARAVRRGDDEVAVALIQQKDSIAQDVTRVEEDLVHVRDEVEAAKVNLAQFRGAIRALEREKTRALATLANARARQRIQEALKGLSVDSEMQALDSVREHISRLVAEGKLDGELEDDGLRARIREIREEARTEAAHRELEELKRRLLPVIPARSNDGVPIEAAPV
jgi:phage shock protein A